MEQRIMRYNRRKLPEWNLKVKTKKFILITVDREQLTERPMLFTSPDSERTK